MVIIILAASNETVNEALKAGFKECRVLVRFNPGISTEAEKHRLEKELRELRPYQFLMADSFGSPE